MTSIDQAGGQLGLFSLAGFESAPMSEAPVEKTVRLQRIKRVKEHRELALSLRVLPEEAIRLPATRARCDQRPQREEDGTWVGGVCPVIRCRWNLLIDVRRFKGAETIIVGARGGTGEGVSLPIRRDHRGQVRHEDLEEVVDAIVKRAESLPSTCMWDYVEDAELAPASDDTDEPTGGVERLHMTLEQLASVWGMTREGARRSEGKALDRLEALCIERGIAPDFVPANRLRRRGGRVEDDE